MTGNIVQRKCHECNEFTRYKEFGFTPAELNSEAHQQRKKIDESEALCMALLQRLKEVSPNQCQAALPPDRPPH